MSVNAFSELLQALIVRDGRNLILGRHLGQFASKTFSIIATADSLRCYISLFQTQNQ